MIAVDANILLEIIELQAYANKVRFAIAAHLGKNQKLAISTLTVSHIFYLAEAHKVPLNIVEKHLSAYCVYGVIEQDISWALAHYRGRDFEDALQVAAAIRENCSIFMTLDAGLAKKYAKHLNIELI